MKKIDGIELSDLVHRALQDIHAEEEAKISSLIKKKLIEIEGLATEIQRDEKSLGKKKEKLEKAQAKLNKIKEGDWSVLADNDNQKQ